MYSSCFAACQSFWPHTCKPERMAPRTVPKPGHMYSSCFAACQSFWPHKCKPELMAPDTSTLWPHTLSLSIRLRTLVA